MNKIDSFVKRNRVVQNIQKKVQYWMKIAYNLALIDVDSRRMCMI